MEYTLGYSKGSPDEAPVEPVGIAVVSFGYISGVNERNYDLRVMLHFLACLTILPKIHGPSCWAVFSNCKLTPSSIPRVCL